MSRLELSGQRFGRLVVGIRAPTTKKHTAWHCTCDCGAELVVKTHHLSCGETKSCGCLKRERARTLHQSVVRKPKPVVVKKARHGLSRSRAYNIWVHMRGRCENPNHHAFAYYGGRGITLCERWSVFENFYADMGEPPPRHTIERMDNDKGYEPGNCRWATRAEQSRNTSRNRRLTHAGVTLTVSQWAARVGINEQTIASRLDDSGWSVADALTRPVSRKSTLAPTIT